MKFVGLIATAFREIDLGAMHAVVVNKLNQGENRERHTKWQGRIGEQSPDENVAEFPIRHVEYPYDTVWPPVGNIVFPNSSPKLGQGCWGRPFHGCALCW